MGVWRRWTERMVDGQAGRGDGGQTAILVGHLVFALHLVDVEVAQSGQLRAGRGRRSAWRGGVASVNHTYRRLEASMVGVRERKKRGSDRRRLYYLRASWWCVLLGLTSGSFVAEGQSMTGRAIEILVRGPPATLQLATRALRCSALRPCRAPRPQSSAWWARMVDGKDEQ